MVMRVVVVALCLLSLSPALVGAADLLGCDLWLQSGNILMWSACRIVGWIDFNEAIDSQLWLGGYLGRQ
jgi:hypothetical protein